jgi:hypothetical protein
MAFRIRRGIVATVLVVQLLVCGYEFMGAMSCSAAHSECWSWFGAFLLNLPASVLIMWVADKMQTSAFFTGMLFVLIGTAWWSLILHLVTAGLAWVRRALGVPHSA